MDEFGRFVGLTILIATILILVVNLAAISAFVVAFLSFVLLALKVVLVAGIATGMIIAGVWSYKMLARTLDDMRRSQDGTFPMVKKKVYLTWWGRILRAGPSRERFVIPELTEGVFGFDENGEPILMQNPIGTDPRIRALYQQGKTMQAASPGDRVYIEGGVNKPPNITKAAITAAQGSRLLPVEAEEEELEPTIQERAAALESLSPVAKRLIAMGDESTLVLGIDEYGKVATMNVEEQNHLRVHGSPQKGKSSLTRFLGVQVATRGWHLVVFDRRNGKDWLTLGEAAEICNSVDTALFIEQLQLLTQEYLRRDALLGQYNAPNLQALPGDVRPPRVLAVVEELGIQVVNAKAQGSKMYKAVEGMLRRLTAEAGATGIHMVVVDPAAFARPLTPWPCSRSGSIGASPLAPSSGKPVTFQRGLLCTERMGTPTRPPSSRWTRPARWWPVSGPRWRSSTGPRGGIAVGWCLSPRRK